jgi:hypothetical protein
MHVLSCLRELNPQGQVPELRRQLVARPRRRADKIAKFPASTERVFKPEGCANRARLTGQVV